MEQLVEGWTEPVRQQLLADGAAINGTGLTLTLELRDREYGVVDTSAAVVWSSASTGIAQYTPADGDLVAARGPYRARWKVTDGTSSAYYPNAEPDVWQVRPK
jgi:hypothetical protein